MAAWGQVGWGEGAGQCLMAAVQHFYAILGYFVGAHIFVWYLSTTLDVRMSASVFTSKPYINQLCADSLLPSVFRLNCLLSINLRVYVYSYVECVLVVWL